MEIVRYTLEVGKELTSEEYVEMASRIEAASKRPYVYDPDCSLLTLEQLAEFRPVNYTIMEERALAMREAGIFNPEMVDQEAIFEVTVNKSTSYTLIIDNDRRRRPIPYNSPAGHYISAKKYPEL
jgi:hypothetical protein